MVWTHREEDSEYIGGRMLETELPGWGKERPKRRFLDVEKEKMQLVGVTEQEDSDRVTCTQVICSEDPD